MKHKRSAVIIIENNHVALIKRENERGIYYTFPGGGVEEDESLEETAIRESFEELGVRVVLERLILKVIFGQSEQYYFSATIVAGEFGTGLGEELTSSVGSINGSYTPVWLDCKDLKNHKVHPEALASLISAGSHQSSSKPIIVTETPS